MSYSCSLTFSLFLPCSSDLSIKRNKEKSAENSTNNNKQQQLKLKIFLIKNCSNIVLFFEKIFEI